MVSYEFYVNQYKGTAIPAAEWPSLSQRAEDVLARYKRYYRVTAPAEDAESMAVCAMAEGFSAFGGGVKSAEIGSVSVTFDGSTPRQREQALYSTACRYLDIYRGAENGLPQSLRSFAMTEVVVTRSAEIDASP